MGDEIELVSDGDGVVLLGDAGVIDRFLTAEGLPSRNLGVHRISTAIGVGAGALGAGSKIAAASGRWVKLTEHSARVMRESSLMAGSAPGLARAIALDGSTTKHILQIVQKSPAGLLSNPAVLANAAALMTQLALQQSMDEIADYLAVIDAKVDDLLRAQKDAALSPMIGAELVVEDAMTVREQVGGVSEVTWSKVQGTPATIAQTQAYAVRRIDAITQRLEQSSAVGDVAKAAQSAEADVREWLAVLARCFQLQDAVAVLELDRVLGGAPEELDRHRAGIRIARQNRLDTIAQSTERLLVRMDEAAGTANAKVLLHPIAAQAVVTSGNRVASSVLAFHQRLGIASRRESVEARRWVDAAVEVRDRALEAGVEGVDAARQIGDVTFDRARSVTGRVAGGIAERARRRRASGEPADDQEG